MAKCLGCKYCAIAQNKVIGRERDGMLIKPIVMRIPTHCSAGYILHTENCIEFISNEDTKLKEMSDILDKIKKEVTASM